MTRRAGWKARLVTTIAVIVALFGGAGPVAADTLVTNLSTSASGREGLADSEYIQSFTTGPNASGYLLESISIDFVKGSVGARDPVYVYLYEDNGSGRPRSRAIATLTKNGVNFAPPVTGVNKYKVWKARCYPQPPHGGGCLQDPSSVHLAPNTTYWVYVWAGRSTTGAELQSDTATTESGATGWTLGDSAFSKPSWGSSDGVYTYTSISAPLLIKVEGKTIPPVKITIDDASATEGVDLTADFTVSLSRAADGKVTVDYAAIAIETAIANDFEAGTGSLTFQPGETRKTISIPVYDDASGSEGDETFIVRLLRPTGATFEGNASFIDGTGTIVNASVLLIDLAAATGTEASGKIDFRLFLNRATNRPTVISYSVNYNAGASPADLVQETTTGTATIAAGETETTISIGIVDDTISDNNEQFRLEIDKAQGTRGALQRTFRTGTILNSETLEASFENVPAGPRRQQRVHLQRRLHERRLDHPRRNARPRVHRHQRRRDGRRAHQQPGRPLADHRRPGRRRCGDDHAARQPGLRDSGSHLLEGGQPGPAEPQSLGHGRGAAGGGSADGELLERARQPRRRGLQGRPDLQRGSRRRL